MYTSNMQHAQMFNSAAGYVHAKLIYEKIYISCSQSGQVLRVRTALWEHFFYNYCAYKDNMRDNE